MDYPDWLPESVKHEAERILLKPYDPDTKETVKRLTTRLEMKGVWEKLSNHDTQPKGRSSIISQVLSSLSYWKFAKENNLLLKPSERNSREEKIIHAINRLQELFRKNHLLIPDYDPDSDNPVDLELNAIKKLLGEFSIFWVDLPTKIHASKAKQTFLIQHLKRFMSSQYGKAFNQEVAIIACMVFDTTDIDEDDVKHVKLLVVEKNM